MASRLAVLPAVATLLASIAVVVLPSSAQAASVDCTYPPVLPKRIVVKKPTFNFLVPVRISGTDCTHEFTASESLVHKSDTYFLNWTQDSHTASDAVFYSTVKAGTYRTRTPSCGVTGSDGSSKSCAVGAGSTVIKFAGHTHLSGHRLKGSNKKKVTFTVKATRFNPYTTKYVTTEVAIERHSSNGWHTVHTGVAKGKHGYTWTAHDADTATYRAVSAESSTAFSAVSAAVTR